MDEITVNHNNLPEVVSEMYKDLIDTRELVKEIVQKLGSYNNSPKVPDNYNSLLTLEETCVYLKISKNTIHRWMKQKVIPYTKMSRRTYFKIEDLENYNRIEVKKPKALRR